MVLHLHREIELLKKHIIHEATMVEDNLRDSILALIIKDEELANDIIARDDAIDIKEVELEEECLKIFALYQPVAVDLRYLVAFLKLNNDLERIGDLASNIAARAASLSRQKSITIPDTIPKISTIVQKMLKNSIEAIIDLDGKKAADVLEMDDEVDAKHFAMFQMIADRIKEQPDSVESWLEVLAISRYLERIADHCTNICEDVEYMLSGHIHRHQNKS